MLCFITAVVDFVLGCFAFAWYSHLCLGFAEYSKVNKIYFVTHVCWFPFFAAAAELY